MIVKKMEGYILGVSNDKFHAIISDNEKSYQLDCEYDMLGLNKEDLIPERKFMMLVDENDEVEFDFSDSYINENITLDDLKKLRGIE